VDGVSVDAGVPAQARDPLLPPESPLAMPVQTLRAGKLHGRRFPSTPGGMFWRRAAVIGTAMLLTLVATYQIWWLLRGGGTDVLETVLLVLFVLLFAWIVQAFVGALAGFVLIVSKRRARLGLSAKLPQPALSSRTALLMPTYNEDPQRLMAGLQAIHESLAATGQLDRFDFFVLSDTRSPEIQEAERVAFAALRTRLGAGARVFYRLRGDNHERKAGNISDWVRRWGDAYPQFLILDADSLMTGDTIVRLAGAMEGHADVALIQTLPVIVNGNTLFARMQQFAARVYGPVIAYGVAWWPQRDHPHACVRRPRRIAGTARSEAVRGHRAQPRFRRGCAAASRWLGIAHGAGPRRQLRGRSAVADRHAGARPPLVPGQPPARRGVAGARPALGQPLAPADRHRPLLHRADVGDADAGRAGDPAAPCRVVVGQPRVVGVLADELLARTGSASFRAGVLVHHGDAVGAEADGLHRGCGGAWRSFVGMLLETVLAALMAPITMYVQSRGVAEVLAGRDSGWESQRRDDGSLPFSGLLRSYGGLTLLGVLVGGMAYLISPGLAAWMAPVILGLVLSIPIVMLTSARAPGQWLRRRRIFCTPEELSPPAVLVRASALRAKSEVQVRDLGQDASSVH
jgi:membrane glycosyltransferase